MEIFLSCQELGKVWTENLKTSYFHHSTQTAGNDKEKYLFLPYEDIFHQIDQLLQSYNYMLNTKKRCYFFFSIKKYF